jgi:bifunctional enzyme CysN/CysC
MDLASYSQQVFEDIRREYTEFLARLGVHPISFIPIAAREGVNIAAKSVETPWYEGPCVLEQIDSFGKTAGNVDKPFRMPVQDIYKFTAQGDSRRIVAGTIETGAVHVGDEIVFYPSGKRSKIESIEGFHTDSRTQASAGEAAGMTLVTEIYIKPSEIMCKAGDPPPAVARRLRANLFWMGRAPMIKGKQYLFRIGAAKVAAQLADIHSVLDASELTSVRSKQQIDRHDVAEIVIETLRPVAFDRRNDIEPTGRFVIVDDYEIAGAGVVLEPLGEQDSILDRRIEQREYAWEKGDITPVDREHRFNHKGKFILFNGANGSGKRPLAKLVEKRLYDMGCNTYFFGIANQFEELDAETATSSLSHGEHVEKLGELARIMTDAGLLMITTITNIDDFDLERLRKLNHPNEVFVVNIGQTALSKMWVDVQLDPSPNLPQAVQQVVEVLSSKHVLLDYSI